MKIGWDIDEDTDKPAKHFVTAHKKGKPIHESSGNVSVESSSATAGVKRAKIVYDLEERAKPKSSELSKNHEAYSLQYLKRSIINIMQKDSFCETMQGSELPRLVPFTISDSFAAS